MSCRKPCRKETLLRELPRPSAHRGTSFSDQDLLSYFVLRSSNIVYCKKPAAQFGVKI